MFSIKPKTRKEIYMAYLAGDMSLELPEPLTRDEVTLYNLCQSHAYGSTTTVKEVLAECQPEFVADNGYFMFPVAVPLADGEKYIVNWNGKEYACKAIAMTDEVSVKTFVIGNLAVDGGEDTGEPFAIMYQWAIDGEYTIAMPLDGSTTLTISIRQEVTEVKKISGKYVEGMGYVEDGVVYPIDQKFLPSGGGEFVVTFEYDIITQSLTCDRTYEEIIAAKESGSKIQAYKREIVSMTGEQMSYATLPNVRFIKQGDGVMHAYFGTMQADRNNYVFFWTADCNPDGVSYYTTTYELTT